LKKIILTKASDQIPPPEVEMKEVYDSHVLTKDRNKKFYLNGKKNK